MRLTINQLKRSSSLLTKLIVNSVILLLIVSNNSQISFATTDTHVLKFHLFRMVNDTVILPELRRFTNRQRTTYVVSRPSQTLVKTKKYIDSAFSAITIKVFEGDDTTEIITSGISNLKHTFGPINKSALNYNLSNGQGTYTLTGLTASRLKYTACIYKNGDSFVSVKQVFHIMSEVLKPLPESPTHPSNIATAPEPPILDMPIGAIIPYICANFSKLEPGGWFLCDGRPISSLEHMTADEKAELSSLFTSAGNPNPNNLPDLRGYFLRGVDGGTGNDPGHASRTGSGHRLGGVQDEAFKSHNHTQDNHTHTGTTDSIGNHNHGGLTGDGGYARSDYARGPGEGHVADNTGNHNHSISTDGAHKHTFTTAAAASAPTINHNGGNETRPKNVGVSYIVKVRR